MAGQVLLGNPAGTVDLDGVRLVHPIALDVFVLNSHANRPVAGICVLNSDLLGHGFFRLPDWSGSGRCLFLYSSAHWINALTNALPRGLSCITSMSDPAPCDAPI